MAEEKLMDDDVDRTEGIYNEPAAHPEWPKDGEHLWGRWYAHAPRKGSKPPTQHRQCQHPACGASEVRKVAG